MSNVISSLYKSLNEWFWWNWHDEKGAFSIWLFGPPVTIFALWFFPRTLPLYLLGSFLLWLLGMGFYIRLTIWRERNIITDAE